MKLFPTLRPRTFLYTLAGTCCLAVVAAPQASAASATPPGTEAGGVMAAVAASTDGCTLSPDSFGAANFKPACDHHDICYSATSTTDRLSCDGLFRTELFQACAAAYPAGGMRTTCYGVAETYYGAVRTFGWYYYRGAGRA